MTDLAMSIDEAVEVLELGNGHSKSAQLLLSLDTNASSALPPSRNAADKPMHSHFFLMSAHCACLGDDRKKQKHCKDHKMHRSLQDRGATGRERHHTDDEG